MYSCLIPSTVSSSCRKVIWFELGANLVAYLTTFSGNVAEKRTTWTVFGSILNSESAGGYSLNRRSLHLDAETLFTKSLLVEHIVRFIKYKYFDLHRIKLTALDHVQGRSRGAHHD